MYYIIIMYVLFRPLGIPHMEQVTVHNPDSQNSLHLLSISGSSQHFHCSFFQDKVRGVTVCGGGEVG